MALRAAEDDGFDAFYRGHFGSVYRFSLSRVRNPDDAEDVAQATFLNAYQAYKRGHRSRNPNAWLIAVARNICHDRHRRSLSSPQTIVLAESMGFTIDERDDHAGDLLSALQGVPERQRTALVLHELEGRSRAEISETLGTTQGGVSTLLFQARRNLREQLTLGVTCERAQRALPQLQGPGLQVRERRAIQAHLRFCERCGASRNPKQARSGLAGTFWLGLGKLSWRSPHRIGHGSDWGGAAAGGAGATLAGKAVVAATVATLAGGVAWDAATRAPTRHSPVPGATDRQSVAPDADGATARFGPAPGRIGTRLASSTPGLTARSRASRPSGYAPPTHVSPRLRPRQAAVRPIPSAGVPLPTGADQYVSGTTSGDGTTSPTGADPAADLAPSNGGATAAPIEPTTQAGGTVADTTASPATVPGTPASGAPDRTQGSAGTQADPGTGQATAPGRQDNPGQGNSAGAQADNGNGNGTSPGQATAPGQQDNPGQGNSADAQANPGNGNGQVTTPGQGNLADAQTNPGNGNGQVTTPGQGNLADAQTNPGNGKSNGQTTAPGQGNDPGQGNSGGNGRPRS